MSTLRAKGAIMIYERMISALMCILIFAVCSCMPRYAVDFQTVDFTNIGLDRTNFNAKVWVSYKWFQPLTISSVRYQLYVNNYMIGEGEYPEEIFLGKNADTLLSFPCTVKYQDVALPLIDVLLKGKFDYDVKMDLKIKIDDWSKRINTQYSGTRKL